jgi:tRNA A-37 threonylcarbamoyl transferase component Bud32
LLASGRDSDIFEYEPGLVLRRSREGRSMEYEARVMEYVRAEGYPVPAVDEISDDGTDLVMERIDGYSMVEAMNKRPWTIPRQGAALATLHHQLHAIAAPEWMQPSIAGAAGAQVIHLDLHPLNVMISGRGPIVIDWPNGRRGAAETDVAVTWVLSAAGQVATSRLIGAVLGRARGVFLRNFLKGFDLEAVKPHMRAVVEWKCGDPHMSQVERDAMWAVVRSVDA